MNKVRLTIFTLFAALISTACSYHAENKGTITLDVQDKMNTKVIASQDLPSNYPVENGTKELEKFEYYCRDEIRASQLDGSEEVVFENIKHGIHGQVEFKKCTDRVTRIYRY